MLAKEKPVLIAYPAPVGAADNGDFSVRVRVEGREWQDLFPYNVKVDMHKVRDASMVYFDFSGTVEIEVTKNTGILESFIIRPLSDKIHASQRGNTVAFKIDRPLKLSLEVNGDRFHNLHLFANPLEKDAPDPNSPEVIYYGPSPRRNENIVRIPFKNPLENNAEPNPGPRILYFGPGIHYVEEVLLQIPSGTTVYLAGGAVVVASFICENVRDITIRGRGILNLANFERFTAFRGIRITYSKNIRIEGITVINPPHYSIYIGQSEGISINNFKAFSCMGWSDGIDSMSSSDILINDVFLRTSDDCIAIYGHRWEFDGDSRNIRVTNSILWADVAHPLNIGTHGAYHQNGSLIENIAFNNLDILEHHELQPQYLGCMAIDAGDQNTIRNIRYERIRVEPFENGRLFDIRVVQNPDYNPKPGNRIENIIFKDVFYQGSGEEPSVIQGFDAERVVDGVVFENLNINGHLILDAEAGKMIIGPFALNVAFKK